MRVSDTSRRLLIAVLGALLFIWGCGNDDGRPADTADPVESDSLTIEKEIEAVLNTSLDRVRLGDKSGLWENEFEYLRERETFDKYVTRGEISYANADTLSYVEVTSVVRYPTDSALVGVVVHCEVPTGRKSTLDDDVIVYFHNGRWIKPTVSVISQQVMYDSIRNEAIKAAEREAEG